MPSDLTTKILTTRPNMASDFDYALHQLLTELSQSHDALAAANRRVEELERFARDIATNYDHESAAHRYGTPCRMCEAEKILTQTPKEYDDDET